MKLQAPYFGNRFANVLKNKAAKKSSKAKAKVNSEMEALEPRILLSGVGTGMNKRNVVFFDADGDRVAINMQGPGSFDISLFGGISPQGNNNDIANLDINANKAGTAGSLNISVAPVGSFTKPIQTKPIFNPNFGGVAGGNNNNQSIQTQYYNLTPGYTNIASITTDATTKQIGSIGLSAVVVPVIDLEDANVGNISINTGMVAKVDQFMAANAQQFGSSPAPVGPLSGVINWTPGLQNIQVWDISAGSIAGINLSGIDKDAYQDPTGAGVFKGNNFLGTLEATTGGIGRITGTNSSFDGTIIIGPGGSLDNVVLGYGFSKNSVINAAGDLSFNASNFAGLINVGGHLNLGLSGNEGKAGFTGTIIAKDGISGLGSSDTDSILVSGVTVTGQLIANGGDIQDIILNQTSLAGTLEADNIGTIRFGNGATLGSATIIANENLDGFIQRNNDLDLSTAKVFVGGTLGLLDVAGGDLNGKVAANSVGEIIVRGGAMNATIFASTSIGDVTVTDGTLGGTLIAQSGNIGDITATNLTAGGTALSSTIFAAGNLGEVLATSVGFGGSAISGAQIQVQGTLSPIEALAYGNNGIGINGITVIAPEINGVNAESAFGQAVAGTNIFISTTLGVSNISATGLTGGLGGSTTITSAKGVSNISGNALNTGDGISSLTVNSKEAITNVVGTAFSGTGINGGTLLALTGDVSKIQGSSNNLGASGNGISDLTITAVAGDILDITGNVAGTGIALNNVNATAFGDIGTVTAKSILGRGIVNGSFETETGDITAISVVSGDDGIQNADIISAGNIGTISVDSGNDGIDDTALIRAGGNVTLIEVTAGDDGIDDSTIDIKGNLTTIDITAGGRGLDDGRIDVAGNLTTLEITAGDDGMNDNTIDVEGNITTVEITSTKNSGMDYYAEILAGGTIGSVAITAKEDGIDYESTIRADGDIGPVIINAGETGIQDNTSIRSTKGSIASLDVTGGTGRAIDGEIFAFNSIGEIKATVTEETGSNAINSDITAVNGKIGDIIVNTASDDSNGISGSNILAGTGIGDVSVTATGDGSLSAISNSTFNANTKPAWLTGPTPPPDYGTLGDITVKTSGFGFGIDNSTFTASKVGDIEVTMNNSNAGHGITASIFTASTSVETVVGSGQYNNYGSIGTITVENKTTTGNFGGINTSVFSAGNAGGALAIGDITVLIENASGSGGIGIGIGNSTFSAVNPSAGGNETIFDSTIGNVRVVNTTEGAAINTVSLLANDGIGSVNVTSQGSGIVNLGITADSDADSVGSIGKVDAKLTGVSGAIGIGGSTWTGASVGNITVDITNGFNSAGGIDFLFITATEKSDAATPGEVENTGSIGNITVTNSGSGFGFQNSTLTAGKAVAGNAIGAVSVTVSDSAALTFSGVTLNATTGLTGAYAPVGGEVESTTKTSAIGQVNSIGGAGIANGPGGLNLSASGSITGIDTDGTGDQQISVDAATVGALVADNMANSKTLIYVVGSNVATLGAITIDAPVTATTANLAILAGGANLTAVTSLGAVSVDGNFNLGSSLDGLTSLGNMAVLGLVTGGSTIGAAGGVNLGTSNNGTISIDTANAGGNAVTFNIDNSGPAFTAPGVLSVGGAPVVTAPQPNGPYAAGGVTFNLV